MTGTRLEIESIGRDLMPREIDAERYQLIVRACEETLAGEHEEMFPNVNEVIAHIAAAVNVKYRLIPAVSALRDAINEQVTAWMSLTLGQEWSGYAGMLSDALERIEMALHGVYRLALGGTAVAEIARLARLPFVSATDKFTVHGAHDALVQLSGTLRTLAVSLYKIANDRRLLVEGTEPNLDRINEYVEWSLMLVTPYVASDARSVAAELC